MIKKHKDGFYPYTPLWVDTTKSEVIIDTIVFNDSMNKAFILLSAKSLYWHRHKTVNGVFKDIGKAFVFDGYGLLAKKNNNNWTYKAYEVQSTLFNNKSDCFERLREIYFHELSIWHPYNDIHYNIDDKRIWNQSIWENF
jgi:hypothetical protein